MAPRRLSPLSIPYRVVQRGGSVVAALGFVLATGGFSLPVVGVAGPVLLVGVASLVALAFVAYEVAYYRQFSYELTADTLDIESGVFARRNREIPIRRVQNVDISRNVIQRAAGIAAVSFETAGGGETEASFRFVSFEEAKRLQRELARLKRGAAADDGDDEPDSVLFALANRELALLGALSFDFRVPGLLFLFFSGSVTVVTSYLPDDFGSLALLLAGGVLLVLAVLASWVVGAALAVANYYGFRLVRSGEELRYERGLLQRYDGSIPFDKVQTLTIEDNPLKRWAGYATLLVETAGYAPGQSDSGSSRGSEAAVPIAERERIERLVEDLERVGTPEFRRPPKRTRRRYLARYCIVIAGATAALYGAVSVFDLAVPWYAPVAFVPVAAVAAHYKWKHRGYWLGENHVVTRNGVLKRETKAVPYYRIQTLIDTRTVFQRRLGLATVTIDTAGSLSLGGQDAAAVDIAAEDADALREELESRLRVAVAAHRAGRVGVGVGGEESVTESVEDGDDGRATREAESGATEGGDAESVDGTGSTSDGGDGESGAGVGDDPSDPFVWGRTREDHEE